MATTYTSDYARPTTASTVRAVDRRGQRTLRIALWVLQAVLAGLFLFTGSMKLLMPSDMLEAQTPLPIALVRFIGMCEAAGALGLVLPGLLRIRTGLTPLAGACLALLMIGATVLTPILIAPDVLLTLMPLAVGVLAAFVAYGRWRLAPFRSGSSRPGATAAN
ncbi:MAG TPA: DoxX family protein [Chloroflexota bacterium]